jgi:hypothetical protein
MALRPQFCTSLTLKLPSSRVKTFSGADNMAPLIPMRPWRFIFGSTDQSIVITFFHTPTKDPAILLQSKHLSNR